MQVLTNQEFTYRQSPTEEDGLAKITDIKGNTLVWNQIAKELTGANYSVDKGSATGTISGGVASITATQAQARITSLLDYVPNHKYLVRVKAKASRSQRLEFQLNTGGGYYLQLMGTVGTSDTVLSYIISPTTGSASTGRWVAYSFTDSVSSDTFEYKSIEIFDLTKMGLDTLTTDQFRALFPLPYYQYDAGSLLSFNGTGIKTTGKNLLNLIATQTISGITFTNDNGIITINGTATATAYFTTEIGLRRGSYFISAFNDEINNNVHIAVKAKSGAYPVDVIMNIKNMVISPNIDIDKFIIYINSGATLNNFVLKPMVSFDSPEYFEPYTETTTDLPISTYFPTGMKSAGTVYDELTPTKAITRIGAVDLGSLEWGINNTDTQDIKRMKVTALRNVISKPSSASAIANVVCANYKAVSADATYLKTVGVAIDSGGDVLIYDPNYNQQSSTSAFKTAMSGVYLYYELATPLENYGVVDLGSLTWVYQSAQNRFYSSGLQGLAKFPSTDSTIANILANGYLTNSATNFNNSPSIDMQVALSVYGSVYLRNLSYTDVTALKNALSGVYLLYEKQNPQGLVYPPQSKEEYPFFKSFKGGTEQLLPENGSVPVTAPILADMNYSSGAIEVTTYPNPEQGGETSGDGWYLVGEEATVNALPNEHYAFNNWVLDGEIVSTDPEYTFEVKDE